MLLALALLDGRVGAQQPPLPQPEPFQLEAPCITQPDLEARLQPLLPESAVSASVLQGVQLRVRAVEAEQQAEIALPARSGQAAIARSLRGENCETVVDAAIIVIGLWVTETQQAAAVPPAAAPPPAEPPRPQSEGAPLHASATLGGAIANRLLPQPSPGVELAGALSWWTLRVALGGRWWPAQTEGPVDARVRASLVEGELTVAWLPLRGPTFEAGPLVGLTMGQLEVAGLGVDNPDRRSLTWLRTELAVQARYYWPGTPIALWITGGATLPWSRPRIVIGGVGTAFRPAAVIPYAAAGVELVLR